MTVKWTRALAEATRELVYEPVTSDLDRDIQSRAREYLGLRPGHEFAPHQVSYTHCLLQRLDNYRERSSHLNFKKAWDDANTTASA